MCYGFSSPFSGLLQQYSLQRRTEAFMDEIHSRAFTSQLHRTARGLFYFTKTAKPIIRYSDFTYGLLCPLWNNWARTTYWVLEDFASGHWAKKKNASAATVMTLSFRRPQWELSMWLHFLCLSFLWASVLALGFWTEIWINSPWNFWAVWSLVTCWLFLYRLISTVMLTWVKYLENSWINDWMRMI